MKATIYLKDNEKPEYKGELLATVKVNPIEGISNREVVNSAINPLKEFLSKTYQSSLIVSIGE